ncbi:MAG: hypothetical protein MZV70_18465 [Desulfobacterales bacterium]|nr:hypothetical protein [Desulfobacterales bacterium]
MRPGASLSHPHSQIVATPIVPKRVKEEIYGADRLFRTFKECGFCRILPGRGSPSGRGSSPGTASFTAFAPYASRFPFEMAVFPSAALGLFHRRPRGRAHDPGRDRSRQVLTRLKETVGGPALSTWSLHQAPNPSLSLKGWPDIHLKSATGTWRSSPS